MLKYNCIKISLPKLGNARDENEDSFSIPAPSKKKSVHFAISDGATESSFSKEWSYLLVSEYSKKPFDKSCLRESLSKLSQRWYSIVNEKELPWYAQQKAETGAFATFFGLTVDKEKHCFDVTAIGDCCLFLIRDEKLSFKFPVSSFKDFSNTPNLFASNPKYQLNIDDEVHYHSDEKLLPNDILLLATDALAAWIFKQMDDEKKPWLILRDILRNKQKKYIFEKWLNDTRIKNEIKNDDVTLLMIKFK
jgi:serine/threonine protein phosphatase PrpC